MGTQSRITLKIGHIKSYRTSCVLGWGFVYVRSFLNRNLAKMGGKSEIYMTIYFKY